MKFFKALFFSTLLSLSWQLMAMDPPQQPVDKMSLNHMVGNNLSLFQIYKELSEMFAKKNDHPLYAAKMKETNTLAGKFMTEPMTCQSVIYLYRYFDFDGIFLSESSERDILSKKIKDISSADNCKEEYKKAQSDYASKRFNELLQQTVHKEDTYAIKVIDRFLIRYRAFLDDRELVKKVLKLKKEGNVVR